MLRTDPATANRTIRNARNSSPGWINPTVWRVIPVTAVFVLLLRTPVTLGGHDTTDVRTINVDRVKLLLDAGEDLFIIDLRPAKEFQEKRIPGARSIPLSDLQRRLREIPKTGRVIFYSWIERNQTLDEVSQLFEDNGYRNVAMLLEGFQAWVKHNYPVERGRR